jgi:hypothetical protein
MRNSEEQNNWRLSSFKGDSPVHEEECRKLTNSFKVLCAVQREIIRSVINEHTVHKNKLAFNIWKHRSTE